MRFLRSLLLITTAVLPTAAFAQEAPNANTSASEADGGTIFVTALRRETALQDVPLAVTAVSSEQLDDRGVKSLSDFANGAVPSLQVAPFAGSRTTLSISSRGISAPDSTQGTQELPVPVYLDGVPLGRGQGLGLELIDPERVEFLRGPQGQLFGRNAEGGAVQFVSRRPSGEFGFDARVSIGNYGADAQRLRVDLPAIGNLRLQGSVARTQHDGYTKNSATQVYAEQNDWDELESFGFRLAAEWEPVEGLRLNYAYDDADIDDTQSYLTWVPVAINGRPPFSPQPAFNGEFPDDANSPTSHEGFNTKSSGHALTIQYDVNDNITLKSISSMRETSRNGSGSLGDALVAGVRLALPSTVPLILTTIAREDVEQEQSYQELQFLGSWDNFDLTFGGSYFNEKVEDQRRSLLQGPGLAAGTVRPPDPPPVRPDAFVACLGNLFCQTSRTEQNAETDSFGVYAQGTYTIGQLELTAGVRYTDDKKVANRTYDYLGFPNIPAVIEAAPSGPLPPQSLFREKRWDPAFVAKYNFSDDVNVYARYATGYRAGGVNVRSSDFRTYGAEDVEAFEIGLKARLLDNRLTFNISAYQNNINNGQITFQEQPTTNPSLTTTINSGDTTKVKGIEVETALRVTDGLTLSASYAYMDARETLEIDNPITTAVVDLTRFYTVQTPKHSGNVALDYNRDIGSAELRFHVDYSFASDHHVTGAGQLVASFAPTYVRPETQTSMLNGRFALGDIDLGPTRAEIALFGKNLLDETNFTFGFDGAAAGGGFGQFIQAPRTYGVELRLQM